jgi:hypothetical protein
LSSEGVFWTKKAKKFHFFEFFLDHAVRNQHARGDGGHPFYPSPSV